MTQKYWDEKLFKELQDIEKLEQRIATNKPVNAFPDDSLIYQNDGPVPKISFRPASGQKVINKRDAAIVFGKDRPGKLESGYGGKGAPRADAIDIVVGRMAAANEGMGPQQGSIVDPHFGADAARIYISQLTDIDSNFALVDKEADKSFARSAIGIKADAVRIIGREGVKIVTGQGEWEGWGETNSRGGKIIQPAPPIKFIAGNRIGEQTLPGGIFLKNEKVRILQPIPKGDNLVLALKELHMLLEKVMSAVFNIACIQTAFNGTLTGEPLLVSTKVTGPVAAQQILTSVTNNVYQTRINSNLWENNYLEPHGYRYINSENVSCT